MNSYLRFNNQLSSKISYLILLLLLISTSSCLRTRSDLAEQDQKKEMKNQLTTLQQFAARDEVRYQDFESQLRSMNGKIEALEFKINELIEKGDKKSNDDSIVKNQRDLQLKTYEDAIRSLQTQLNLQIQEIENLKALALAKSQITTNSPTKGNFTSAEEAYKKKDWKSAILGYQKYREANPKGRRYAHATLRIGISFVELGLKADAKPFFEEVVEKFPKSAEAKEAKNRLK